MAVAPRNEPNVDFSLNTRQAISEMAKLGAVINKTLSPALRLAKQVSQVNDVKTDRAVKQVDNVNKKLSETTREAEKTNRGFSLLRATLASLAGNIGSNLVFGLQELAVEMIRVGVEADRMATRFIALSNTIREGNRQYSEFLELSQRFGVTFEPVLEVATALRAAGFEAAETTDTIEQLIVASGGSAQAIEGIGRSLRQMAAGKVEMEELTTIADNGVPILRLLAEHFGITTKEVLKLSEASKITFEDISTAFRSYTVEGSAAREAAEETATTIAASFERLKNELREFARDVSGAFEEPVTTALDIVSGSISGLREEITDEYKEIRETIIKENDLLVNNLSDDFAFTKRNFLSFIDDVSTALNSFFHGSNDEGLTINEYLSQRLSFVATSESNIVGGETLEGARERLRFIDEQIDLYKTFIPFYEEANRQRQIEINWNKELLKQYQENPELYSAGEISELSWRVSRSDPRRQREGLRQLDAINERLDYAERAYEAQVRFIQEFHEVFTNVHALTKDQQAALENINKEVERLKVTEFELEEIEKNRLEEIRKINEQVKFGFVEEEDAKRRIQAINENSVLSIHDLLTATREYIDTLDNPSLVSTWNKLYDDIVGKQKTLVDLTKETYDEAIPERYFESLNNFTDAWRVNLERTVDLSDELYTLGFGITSRVRETFAFDPRLIETAKSLRDIEEQRIESLEEINLQYKEGFITFEEYQRRLQDFNEDAVIDTGLILNNVRDYISTLSDETAIRRWNKFYENAVKQNERILFLLKEAEKARARIRSTAQNRTAQFETAYRVQNPDEFSTYEREPLLDLTELDNILEVTNTITDAFSSLGDIIRNGANNELQAMTHRLEKIRLENQKLAREIEKEYDDERDEIEDNTDKAIDEAAKVRDDRIADAEQQLVEGKINSQQLSEIRQRAEQDYQDSVDKARDEQEKAEKQIQNNRENRINVLRNKEIEAQNAVRQHQYELQLQAFYFDKGIKLARTFSDGIAGLLRAASDGEWGHFAALLGAGVLQGIALGIGKPPPRPPSIPSYADGGYVDRPTIASVGDGGEGEWMVPNSIMRRIIGRNRGDTIIVKGSLIRENDLGEFMLKKQRRTIRSRRY